MTIMPEVVRQGLPNGKSTVVQTCAAVRTQGQHRKAWITPTRSCSGVQSLNVACSNEPSLFI